MLLLFNILSVYIFSFTYKMSFDCNLKYELKMCILKHKQIYIFSFLWLFEFSFQSTVS